MKKRGQNEGSIYCGTDGRWRAIVPARYSANGKRRMIVGSKREGNTREAVARKLAVALAGSPGESLVPARETVALFLARWLASVAGRVRPKTLEGYSYTVERMIVPIIGSMRLQAMEPHHVVAMMTRLQADGRASRSVAYARSVLRIALTAAKRMGLVTRNVADREYVQPPRVERASFDVHGSDAVAAVLTQVDPPHRLLIATIAALGLRVGEALGLRWREIDFAARTLRIVRAVQRQRRKGLVFVNVKTSRSRRSLLVPHVLLDGLKEHRRAQLELRMLSGELWEDNDLVFPARLGSPMDPRNALRILHRAEARANVPRIGLHKLRHSAATILLANNVPLDVVSDILGHSSIRVTKDTYAHFVVGRQEGAASVMDRIVQKKG